MPARAFRPSIRLVVTACAAALVSADPASAQQGQARRDSVRVVPVAPGVHVLVGRGGNIGVSSGPDGVFLVDDQYAPATGAIRAAVATLSGGSIRFVLNTHWHGDHTGGNENLARTGTLIVAHDNVRRRMSTEQFIAAFNDTVPPSPAGALPVVTFADAVTFHLNGDEIHAFHVPPAHTDGDAIVHWKRANVVHMGDTYFNGVYPFIDLSSGGSVEGVIGVADRVLAMADSATKIIPGHGALSNAAELRAYRDMLVTARDRIRTAVATGKTLEQLKAERPLADLDARWGRGFVTPDAFLETLFRDLSARR